MQQKIHGELAAVRDELAAAATLDVAAFNDLLRQTKAQGLLAPKP